MSDPVAPTPNIRGSGVVIPHDQAPPSDKPETSIWQNRIVTVGIPVTAMLIGGAALAVGLTVLSGGTAGIILAVAGGAFIGLAGIGGTVGLAKYTPPPISQKQIDNVTKDVTASDEPDEPDSADVELEPVKDPEADPLKATPVDEDDDKAVPDGTDVDPTLSPESGPKLVKKDGVELPIAPESDLSPASSLPFSSPATANPEVEKAFQELTGQPFHPIYTQRNSYAAHEVLDQVANKDRIRLEQSLERFKLKYPKSYPALIEKAIELAEGASTKDQGIINLLKAEKSFVPPPASNLPLSIAPSYFVPNDSPPRALVSDEPPVPLKKDSSWSPWLKGLGVAAGVAAVGALASWYFDVNPLNFFSSFGKGQADPSRGPIFGPENMPEGYKPPTGVPVDPANLNNSAEAHPFTTQERDLHCDEIGAQTVSGIHAPEPDSPYSPHRAYSPGPNSPLGTSGLTEDPTNLVSSVTPTNPVQPPRPSAFMGGARSTHRNFLNFATPQEFGRPGTNSSTVSPVELKQSAYPSIGTSSQEQASVAQADHTIDPVVNRDSKGLTSPEATASTEVAMTGQGRQITFSSDVSPYETAEFPKRTFEFSPGIRSITIQGDAAQRFIEFAMRKAQNDTTLIGMGKAVAPLQPLTTSTYPIDLSRRVIDVNPDQLTLKVENQQDLDLVRQCFESGICSLKDIGSFTFDMDPSVQPEGSAPRLLGMSPSDSTVQTADKSPMQSIFTPGFQIPADWSKPTFIKRDAQREVFGEAITNGTCSANQTIPFLDKRVEPRVTMSTAPGNIPVKPTKDHTVSPSSAPIVPKKAPTVSATPSSVPEVQEEQPKTPEAPKVHKLEDFEKDLWYWDKPSMGTWSNVCQKAKELQNYCVEVMKTWNKKNPGELSKMGIGDPEVAKTCEVYAARPEHCNW